MNATETPDTPQPNYREHLRGALIATVGRVLEAEGLEAVQARRVARESGCSVGTLYNIFGDIDGLMIAVNAETLSMLGNVVGAESGGAGEGTLVEKLTRLGHAYLRFATDHHKRWDAVFRHRMLPGKAVPQSYIDDQERLLKVIADTLGEAVGDEDKRASVARVLFGAVHGVVVLALDNRIGGKLLPEVEQQVALIIRLAVHGLEAGAASGA
ncbi:MAG: TetR/AcrR family transcriptional regulator [Hyphomicrobiaceae bacterium]